MKNPQSLWFNLPVKDVAISRAFYENIGFELNEQYANNEHSASFYVSQQRIVMMLFQEEGFQSYIRSRKVAYENEVLFSISADSQEEVDQLAAAVKSAGGQLFSAPKEIQGWMYSCGFSDPDGHKWNALFMDPTKMPGSSQ